MGMSKRACQGGRTNSGELLSSTNGDATVDVLHRLPGWHPGHPHPTPH